MRASRIGFSLPVIDTTAFGGRAREQGKTSRACRRNCGDFVDAVVTAHGGMLRKPGTLPRDRDVNERGSKRHARASLRAGCGAPHRGALLSADHRAVSVNDRSGTHDARPASGATVGRIENLHNRVGERQCDMEGELIPRTSQRDTGRRIESGDPHAWGGGHEERN